VCEIHINPYVILYSAWGRGNLVPRLFPTRQVCLLHRPSLCHGKVTISRGPAESCKMSKCCSKPASLKKAVLFLQHWCGQQTLLQFTFGCQNVFLNKPLIIIINASFHVLRVASLIYKFHAAFLYPVYIQDYV
jgi:hypothetical protein